MRRWLLLFLGLGGCGVVLLALCMHVAAQYAQPAEEKPFPCVVEGTPLRIVSLAGYDGPFWEDGSDREVVEVAALLVENQSSSCVEQGAVVIDWGEDRFVFEFTWLPPQSRTLVLESTAKRLCLPQDFRCYGWSRQRQLPQSPVIAEVQNITLRIMNPTGEVVPMVTVYYKHCYEGIYIGGITYRASAQMLEPGQWRILCPAHFSGQGSSIICLKP